MSFSFFRHRTSRIQARCCLLFVVSFAILSIHLLKLAPNVYDYANRAEASDVTRTRFGNRMTRVILYDSSVKQATVRNTSVGRGIVRNMSAGHEVVRNTLIGQQIVRNMSFAQGVDERNNWQKKGARQGAAASDTFDVRTSQSNRNQLYKTDTEITRYICNCSNIHRLSLKHKIGDGISKQVFLAQHKRMKVAVKMVTRNIADVISCMRNADAKKSVCYKLSNAKLMKEILLLQQLNHPNLLRMLGYCVRSEEVDSTSLRAHGIIAVHEYGLPVDTTTLQTWPLHMRISTAIDLADLLDYFERSPLGSLRIPYFKETDFLLCEGRIKLIDLDDVTVAEPNCHVTESAQRKCAFGLKCVGGVCPGYNAKYNMDRMNRVMFSVLLSDSPLYPTTSEQIGDVRRKLNYAELNPKQLKMALQSLLKAQNKTAITLQML